MLVSTLSLLISIYLLQIYGDEWWKAAITTNENYIVSCRSYHCLNNTCTQTAEVDTMQKCTAATCMEVWVEHMAEAWLDSGRGRRTEFHAPKWSPMEDIECSVNYDSVSTCVCNLPAQNSQNLVIDTESMRSMFIGDSTIRNFRTFLISWIKYRLYSSLSVDRPYEEAFEDIVKNSLVYSMRGGPPTQFISAITNYQAELKNLPGQKTSTWRIHTDNTRHSSDTPCMHLSTNNSSIMWLMKSYEVLSEVNYHDTAKEMCLEDPLKPAVFVLTAGLHYLPV